MRTMAAAVVVAAGLAVPVQAHQDGEPVVDAGVNSHCTTGSASHAAHRSTRQGSHDEATAKPCDFTDPSRCPYGGCSQNDMRMRRTPR